MHICFSNNARQTFSLGNFFLFHSLPKKRIKITLNDNVQTIIVVWSVLNVESVWGAVAAEI